MPIAEDMEFKQSKQSLKASNNWEMNWVVLGCFGDSMRRLLNRLIDPIRKGKKFFARD